MNHTCINIKRFSKIIFLLLILAICSCQKNRASNKQIEKGIKYLLERQELDGSWDPIKWEGNFAHQDGKISMTALAAMALLAYPDEETTLACQKATDFLLAHQKKDGSIGERNYANGIVFYYFANLISQNKKLNHVEFKSFFEHILKKQSDVGAWDYTDANENRNDMSISAWFSLGLNTLKEKDEFKYAASLSLDKINQMINKDKNGAGDESINTQAISTYTYGEDPNSTSGKVLRNPGTTMQAIILFIKTAQPELRQSNWVETAKRDQRKALFNSSSSNIYQRFFFFQCMQNGLRLDQDFLLNTRKILASEQLPDGSWPLTSAPIQFGGKIMSTALSLLILQNASKNRKI